jgi:MinD-like ATPase involved in chromosome partitioning or flagellar assembly
VEEEHPDRVYVPGTNPAPPDRDVEPFWAEDELEAPVHGRPVPHEAPPAIPLPPPQGGVYQPVDRPDAIPHPSAPQPPGPQQAVHQQPIPHHSAYPPIPVPPPSQPAPPPSQPVPPPSQAWPAAASSGPGAPVSGADLDENGGAPGGGHTDSPWSQPPHRPAPADNGGSAETRATGSVPVPGAARPGYYPTVTPREASGDASTDGAHNGAIYRPGPPASAPAPSSAAGPIYRPGGSAAAPTSGSTHGTAQVPQPPRPHPISAQPAAAPPHPTPPQQPPPPGNPGPYGAPPPAAPPQPGQQYGQRPPVPGPYPPTVDPRALPHPQINQGSPTVPPQQPGAPDPFQDLPWVSDGTPTAEEFARRRMAKQAEPTATMGPRALLRKGTMGLVKLAPGKHEVEFKQDVDMVRRNFGGLRQVTVVNPKGGAGKTIAVLLLAMTFGQKRGGYVLAWDNNETQGTLGMRAQQDFHARTVRDMMRDLHLFRGAQGGRVGDLSQYVRAQGEGMFDVLASDESATAGEMLTASAFAEIREIVSRFYKLIFVDTGNNVRAQNWQAAMDATDQLVITMSARNDSAETAARMLDHLEQSGRQRLVRQAISIVSMPPTRKDIDLPAIQRHFAARTRAVLMAPYEKLIDSGEPLRYGQLSAGTKDAWLKIAAAVAEGL